MFRATWCSSSGESIVSIQKLVHVTLCRWPSSMEVGKDLYLYNIIFIIIIIIIVIIRHQLDPDRPVSVSSNSLFKGLPSRLRPFRLQCCITFDTKKLRRRRCETTSGILSTLLLLSCFYVVQWISCFVSFCVLFVCKCVLNYCHRVAIQLQLTNISYIYNII
jgi:hypothetical protein